MTRAGYKQTELGEIPLEWEVKKLEEFLVESKVLGGTGATAKKITVKLYGKGAIGKINRIAGSKKTQYYVRRRGQFIYGKLDFLNGAFALLPEELDGYESTLDLPTFDISEKVDPVWLFKYIAREDFYKQLAGGSSGSRKARRVHPNEFLLRKVPLPPLLEQQKIAHILESVDRTLEATRGVIGALEGVRRGLMQQLFSRGIPGRHTHFKPSEVGEIPLEWEVKPLTQCAIIQTGIAKGKKYVNQKMVWMPYLRVANVQDSYFDLREIKTIQVAESEVSRYSLAFGDVILTEGGDADKLGRGHIWRDEIPNCLHQNHLFSVRPDKQVLLPEFLNVLTSSEYVKSYFLKSAKQSTNLASINSSQLKALPCLLPPLEQQTEIIETLTRFDSTLEQEKFKLEALEDVKKALMQALLSGRVRVPLGVEAAVP